MRPLKSLVHPTLPPINGKELINNDYATCVTFTRSSLPNFLKSATELWIIKEILIMAEQD